MNEQNEVNFGPLSGLLGSWRGDKGLDVSPEVEGPAENPYRETIVFTAVGDVTNAEEQTLAIVHYTQEVIKKEDGEIFHHQTGYWLWEEATDKVTHSFTIPRGVAVVAVGEVREGQSGEAFFSVSAKSDEGDGGISQSPFMSAKAKTLNFLLEMHLKGDVLSYTQTTQVDIYGQVFDHTDLNELERC